jgi:hypothetical protein
MLDQGWDWASVLPYFKKSENYLGKNQLNYHGYEHVSVSAFS